MDIFLFEKEGLHGINTKLIDIAPTIYKFEQNKLSSSNIFLSGHIQNVINYVHFGRAAKSQSG